MQNNRFRFLLLLHRLRRFFFLLLLHRLAHFFFLLLLHRLDHFFFLKVDILRQNPKVCVLFVPKAVPVPEGFTTHYASAVVRGTAQEVTDLEEKTHALRVICAVFSPDFPEETERRIANGAAHTTGIWRIDIESVSGELKLTLPDSLGFRLEHDSVSGDIFTDIPITTTRGLKTYGNGECSISVESVSGDIHIGHIK